MYHKDLLFGNVVYFHVLFHQLLYLVDPLTLNMADFFAWLYIEVADFELGYQLQNTPDGAGTKSFE